MVSKSVAASRLSKVLITDFPELDPSFLGSVATSLAEELDGMRNAGERSRGSLLLRAREIPWAAQELARLRRSAGLTQKQAAAALDLAEGAVIRRESGVVSFKRHEVVTLAALYRVRDGALIAQLQQAVRKK